MEATVKLDDLVKKIGKAVDDSKPYWEARRVARQVSDAAGGVFCLIRDVWVCGSENLSTGDCSWLLYLLYSNVCPVKSHMEMQ